MLTKSAAAGTLTYTYDLSGNVATIRSSNANGTSVDYTWDDANQLVTITDNRTGGSTMGTYTATGRPDTMSLPNDVGLTHAYDAVDRVTSLAWRLGAAPPFASWGYTFNDRGQRLTATDVTGRSAAYGYDDATRLTSETITNDPQGAAGNGALNYALDAVGNRLSRTSTLAALGAQTFTYDANDQLTSDGYDANGNTTSADGNTYTYDFENRLVSKTGAGGAVTIVYDGDGNRVAKTAGGVTIQYLVDDLNPTGYLQVLEEVSGGAVQTRYTYGTAIVSQTLGVSSTPVTSYYGYDAHGNVTFLTDASGAVTDAYDYDAWGNIVAQTGTTLNTRLYAGEELDPDLGLINLRARQYVPGKGRFLTIDPLANSGPGGRYQYASGDPIDLVDPTGRFTAGEYALIVGFGTATLQKFGLFPSGARGTFAKNCFWGGQGTAVAGIILGAFAPGEVAIFSLAVSGFCWAATGLSYIGG